MGLGNAESPERLHCASVIFRKRVVEKVMRKAVLLAMLALGGCMSEHPAIRPLRPLEIATARYQPLATTTLTGTMMYEGGCLLFRDEPSGSIVMPVLPAGSTFNGTAVSYHLPGKSDQWVAIAQEMLLYGEPLKWSTLTSAAYVPFNHQCGAYPPFFVSAVRPAD
jgi:hypothetical protein